MSLEALDLLPKAKVVGVKFTESENEYGNVRIANKVYHYFTHLDLKVGDKAVVHNGRTYNVVTVVEIDSDPTRATKWIVDRVDTDSYVEHQELAMRAIALRARINAAYKRVQAQRTLADMLDALPAEERTALVEELSALTPAVKGATSHNCS